MLTIAITTYNSSRFLKDTLINFLEDSFFDEIIISDDCSNYYNRKYLQYIISRYNNKKIKVFYNNKNLGGFSNKYIAIKKSKNNFVYLLDSDNYLNSDQINLIKKFKFQSDIVISPSSLNLFTKKNKVFKNIKYKFDEEFIDLKIAKKNIINNLEYFDWFLNTGNFIVNREAFLKATYPPIFENKLQFHEACSVSIFYYLINANLKYHINENFSYYHRVRNDSYWNQDLTKSIASVKHFKDLLSK